MKNRRTVRFRFPITELKWTVCNLAFIRSVFSVVPEFHLWTYHIVSTYCPVVHGPVTSLAFILTPIFILRQLLGLPATQCNLSCRYVSFHIVISCSSNYSKFRSSKPNRGFFIIKTEPIPNRFSGFFWGGANRKLKISFQTHSCTVGHSQVSKHASFKFRSHNNLLHCVCVFVYSCRRVRLYHSYFCCLPFWLHSIQCCPHWRRLLRLRAFSFNSLVSSPTEDASFPLLYKTCRFPSNRLMKPCAVADIGLVLCVTRQHTFRGIWYFSPSQRLFFRYLTH